MPKNKLNKNTVGKLTEKINMLIMKHSHDIEKCYRAGEADKYTFSIIISIDEAVRDNEQVLILAAKISYSEKHTDTEQVYFENTDQLKFKGTEK